MKNLLVVAILCVSAAAHAQSPAKGCFQMDGKYRSAMESSYGLAILDISAETIGYALEQGPVSETERLRVSIRCSRMELFCGEIKFSDTSGACTALRKMTGTEENTVAFQTILNIQTIEREQRNLPR